MSKRKGIPPEIYEKWSKYIDDEPMEPCEDAISRQAALDYCIRCGKSDTWDYLHNLPSVEPVRKTGHWIGVDEEPHEDWECDRCGHIEYADENTPDRFNYCPNCGALMIEPQEREDNE